MVELNLGWPHVRKVHHLLYYAAGLITLNFCAIILSELFNTASFRVPFAPLSEEGLVHPVMPMGFS